MGEKNQQSPVEKYPALGEYFSVLESQQKAHLELTRRLFSVAGGAIYNTDLVVVGVLKRSFDILEGMISLVNQWNFTAAAPLLRLQLDSLLKLVYLAQVPNADAVSSDILAGKRFNQMRDGCGLKLTDQRLREYARGTYDWIDDMYQETSKLVHFSEKHCFAAVSTVDPEDRTVKFFVGAGTPHWPEAGIAELLMAVSHTTDALLKVIEGWILAKNSLGKSGQ